MTAPVRLQLSRSKGFDLQALSLGTNGLSAMNVARPTKWGNPWPIDHDGTAIHCLSIGLDGDNRTDRATAAVDLFRCWIIGGKVNELVAAFLARPSGPPLRLRHIQRDLRAKNLACWCNPGAPYHADVLLEIANGPVCEAVS